MLGVSLSGYYAWRERAVSRRALANQGLVQKMRALHEQSRGTYGSPRLTVALKQAGVACSRGRVERLMRLHGLRGKSPRRWRPRTTQRNPDHGVAPNLLQQAFTATQPNQKWVSDITYLPTQQGWLYLATVMDLFSRKIIGWQMGTTLETHLVTDALQGALQTRQTEAGLLVHSDRGSQYTSTACRQLLADHNAVVSMSRAANCYDNAVMESFYGTLKCELITQPFASRPLARQETFLDIEGFYNRSRLHSSLGYLSPDAYEQRFFDHGV